jgi:translation initiation factor RLI1
MEDYSGGQKKKVLIAASHLRTAHLYIWGRSAQYIDLSQNPDRGAAPRLCPHDALVVHDRGLCGICHKTILL